MQSVTFLMGNSIFSFNTLNTWKASTGDWQHMVILLSACRPTRMLVYATFSLDRRYLRGSLCISTYITIWNLMCDFKSLIVSKLHTLSESKKKQKKKHRRPTVLVPAEKKHALQPGPHAIIAKRAGNPPLQYRPGLFSSCCFFFFSSSDLQGNKYSGRWTAKVKRLSLVKGKDKVSNREPLRSVRSSREAAGGPLAQMTNVRWAFPIPPLSARTNTSWGACVCVMIQCCGSFQ